MSEADKYIYGIINSSTEEFFDIDERNNAVVVKQRANVITGHFLDRDKSYAAARPMRGDPAGTISLVLNMNKNTDKSIKPIYL